MSLSWPDKDPDEVLDYSLNWSPRLDSDTIATSTWVVPAGITKNSDTNTTTTTTIWLSSGVASTTYDILNRITTAGGRTMDQTVKLKVKER
jgi:hypothetical protein